ncbi:ABC transporter permease subunit [Clostridium sp. B9]|uniref:ABC transporter permease subunit n=1 Tax=Clostridium sp. B9 TaxID=3423224 RepID=UPI003D2F1535
MINLLKSDFYRLRKSSVLKISLISMTLIILLLNILFLSEDNFLAINRAFMNDRFYGFTMGDIVGNESYIKFFYSTVSLSPFIIIIILFLVVDMVISRYKNGTLKNVISYGHSRSKIYLANIITIFIGVAIIIIFTLVVSMGILSVIFQSKDALTKDIIVEVLKATGIWIIILSTIASIYSLLATIIKNKAVIATFGALYTFLGTALIIEKWGNYLFDKEPSFMILDFAAKPINNPLFSTWIINCLIIIVVTNILGCIVFNKQEIK